MEETDDKKPEAKSSGSYGKKPLWFWIVLYLVIGIIVYGLIYYFFLNNGSSPISY